MGSFRSLTLGILASALWTGCSKQAPLEQRVVLHPNKSIWKKWTVQRTPMGDTLIHGAYKEFYWNGSPALSTEYRNGQREGTSQAWYENGNAKWTKNYRQNKREGLWRLYTSDGRRLMEAPFRDGQMEGTLRLWDPVDTSRVVTAEYARGQCSGGECQALDSLRNVRPEAGADNRQAALIEAFLD